MKAFIFDLDGVIVDTAKYHFLAWRNLANSLGFEFTEEHNELLKGVPNKNGIWISEQSRQKFLNLLANNNIVSIKKTFIEDS